MVEQYTRTALNVAEVTATHIFFGVAIDTYVQIPKHLISQTALQEGSLTTTGQLFKMVNGTLSNRGSVYISIPYTVLHAAYEAAMWNGVVADQV